MRGFAFFLGRCLLIFNDGSVQKCLEQSIGVIEFAYVPHVSRAVVESLQLAKEIVALL
jgi:hypothetical protein